VNRVGVSIAADRLAETIDTPEWATTIWPIKQRSSITLVVRVHPRYPMDQLKIPPKFMGYRTAVEEDQPGQAGQAGQMDSRSIKSRSRSVCDWAPCASTAS